MFNFAAFIPRAVMQSIPLLLGSTGETITEKSGNLNLGIPGVMYVGAISGVIGSFFYEMSLEDPAQINSFLAILIPMACCLLGSFLMGLLYCFLTVTLRANQNVTGLALTTFGIGFGNFFGGSLIKLTGSSVPSIALSATNKAFAAKLPLAEKTGVFGRIFLSYGFLAYLAIVIALVTSHILTRTRVGLQLRAVGENPATADAAGINVGRYKYLATCIGSMIAGLGGLYYVMDYASGVWSNDAFGNLYHLASERRHPCLDAVRRPLHSVSVYPDRYQSGHQGNLQDAALSGNDRCPGSHQPAQTARGPASGRTRTAVFPRGTIRRTPSLKAIRHSFSA